ncbi:MULTISPECIES: M4 family metallopeptidase [unclassified Microcystis]|uniref:M4 family metallopeptidase n=1 Tax=unclassified Microcystis TaxID=2643300 RepID=UPI00258684A7|nr:MULTISPECIES: M4 family metallopeptidase [unclassified Microcystis]MCA2753303.1 M4 family metallopeptidase [Microcystis sp. M137S2]MCA2761289.1 M4 family metallopeptidase [Microcystis sp. M151S2]MCA2640206.1 M4 family metallopeptidase [Microcystis sp. M087S2]MCA2672911.1 M4 family metallopeptidase [Microcystis sp. M080S2]MCA2733189.1 M4 family metallopeptidase [Microcystis sp. M158S2]
MVCTECNDAPSNGNYGLSRTYNLRYKDYSRNIILTDYGLVDDLCRDFCQQARSNVETVAQFIDDNFNKPLDRYEAIINVNVKDKYGNYPPAGWGRTTRRALFGQREINGINRSYGTDITVVAHEFCHGLIQSISNDRPIDDEFSEKNALEESFCDIFAVLVRNYYRDNRSYWNNPHNWLWDVGENFQEGTGSLRRLDTLLSLRFTDAGNVYQQIQINDRTTAKNYHELSLIHSHAFYRLMTIHNTVINGQPLFNGEFALKLFGAVLEYISTLDSFSESRRVFKAQAEVSLNASPRQLDAIDQAFIDVGIIE